jgi:hypothetical protein
LKDILVARNLFLPLLLLGVLIRLPGLCHPIEEGHRNAQTATLTAGMIEDGRLCLDPIAPWRGDLTARLVLELPIYNLCVLALAKIPGLSLDVAGRSVSLIFWALGFWLLQRLWSQALPKDAHFWANLLFVLAPMSWYLSTAFMPETLVQLLSITFILLVIRHSYQPSSATAAALVVVAGLGLLIKLPSFAHLGIFLILVLVDRGGWRALLNPILITGGLIIVASLLAWSHFIESVNTEYFAYWTGRENLIGFIQPGTSRLSSTFWIKFFGYNLAYIVPPMAAPFTILGFIFTWKARRDSFFCRVWLYLFSSLLISWLVWGKGAAAQNYYNLPNLICFCGFFGVGINHFLQWRFLKSCPAVLSFLCSALLWGLGIAWCYTGLWYLSKPDAITLRVASWVKQNTVESDLLLYQPRHSSTVMDYEHQPLLSHVTGRRTWIWTRSTPAWEKDRALQSSSFLIVTDPQMPNFWELLRRGAKGCAPTPPDSLGESDSTHFIRYEKLADFTVYQRVRSKGVSP